VVWAARKGRGGAGAASACVVGAESTTCAQVVRVDGWGGTGLIGGAHGSVGGNARASTQAAPTDRTSQV
jgi:hypothetical protein